MKAGALVVASLFVLAGCGSTPQPKQPMPEGHYRNLSRYWVGSMVCMNQGNMDTRLVTAVQDGVKMILASWSVDQVKMEIQVRTAQQEISRVDVQTCNQLSVMGQQYLNKVEEDRARNNSGGSGGGYSPSFTTCNRVGAQTFCQSW